MGVFSSCLLWWALKSKEKDNIGSSGGSSKRPLLNAPAHMLLEAATPLGENPTLGRVMDIKSIVHGRDWMLQWEPPLKANFLNLVPTNVYQFDLIGPQLCKIALLVCTTKL
jgi:hypothetical protein